MIIPQVEYGADAWRKALHFPDWAAVWAWNGHMLALHVMALEANP